MNADPIQALREALQFSPENVPLRRHLAESLAGLGRFEEAEQEYRQALARAPEDNTLKIGLARVFFQQEKNSQALVIIEDLLKKPDTPAAVYLLHARLLFRAGDVARAVRQYRAAVNADPAVADPELEAKLGLDADPEESDVVEGKVRVWEGDGGPNLDGTLEKPKITFEDVGGMDTLKEEVRLKIIAPLLHPELYKAYGKAAGGGILMFGPPGCGKTHLARATAGEVRAGFLAVGIHDILDMWIGNSEKNLHELFGQARRNRPCVLFFDEVDALAASRGDLRHSSGRMLINQFLAELVGVKASNDGVLILAATNAPWHLPSVVPAGSIRSSLCRRRTLPPGRPFSAFCSRANRRKRSTIVRWPSAPRISPGPTSRASSTAPWRPSSGRRSRMANSSR
jgi:hypothetical protein